MSNGYFPRTFLWRGVFAKNAKSDTPPPCHFCHFCHCHFCHFAKQHVDYVVVDYVTSQMPCQLCHISHCSWIAAGTHWHVASYNTCPVNQGEVVKLWEYMAWRITASCIVTLGLLPCNNWLELAANAITSSPKHPLIYNHSTIKTPLSGWQTYGMLAYIHRQHHKQSL